MKFINEKIKTLGTAACPPYHLALVIGGLSAELTMKVVKLASTKYLDDLPTTGLLIQTTGIIEHDHLGEHKSFLRLKSNLVIKKLYYLSIIQ